MRLCSLLLSFSALVTASHFEIPQTFLHAEAAHLQSLSSDDKALLRLHRGLIEAESTSQLLEKNAADFLVKYFDSIGWHSQLFPTFGNKKRSNVFAWPGKTNHTRLLVSSHIDTVPPYIPYSVHDGSIYGRGSADAKASVATQIEAIKRLIKKKMISADDVAVLYVVGEETAGVRVKDGMKSFSADMMKENRTWDQVVFGEPTENKVAIGHKGMILFNVSCSGKASHSGYPELGSSANEKLIDVLHQFKHHAWPIDQTLGNTTFNIGKIMGGVAANVVPASASAALSIRVSRDLEGILTYLRNVIGTSPDTSFEIMQAAVPTVLDSLEGTKFEEMVVNYSTDVPNLSREVATGKRYLFGPGTILLAHGDDEHIKIDQLLGTAHDYELIFNLLLK